MVTEKQASQLLDLLYSQPAWTKHKGDKTPQAVLSFCSALNERNFSFEQLEAATLRACATSIYFPSAGEIHKAAWAIMSEKSQEQFQIRRRERESAALNRVLEEEKQATDQVRALEIIEETKSSTAYKLIFRRKA
jgi:hypothetical protein